MDTPVGKSTLGEMLPFLIIIGVLLVIVIFCFKMARLTSQAKKREKQQLNILRQQGLTIHTEFPHVNGLPIAENLLCEIFSFPNRIEFKSGTTNITLMREKITYMCIKTDTEIQQQLVSSIGGTIAGGAMFGTLGAIIGGRAKTKQIKTVTKYLIITYMNNQNQLAYIGFEILNGFALSSAYSLIEEFNRLNTNTNVHIDL